MDCLILGDSIAVGTAMFRPECKSLSKGGITSQGWQTTWNAIDLSARTVIISLGTNDWNSNTADQLRRIRQRVNAEQVFWIVPNTDTRPKVASVVEAVAKESGDKTISTKHWQTDKIHPSWVGYCELVNQTR